MAGTTNGYVAEEILREIGQAGGFSRKRFFRGIILPAWHKTTDDGRLADQCGFPGDVIISNGVWQRGKTIFDVVDDLKEGDVILKGANALDLRRGQAAILVGHPRGGTTSAILQAVAGRRVRLILPVGLEKRITGDLNQLAMKLNAPGAEGPRFLPIPGQVFRKVDAIRLLTGADANLIAAGGVRGAEGSIWLALQGSNREEDAAEELLRLVSEEPGFEL